MRILLLLLSGIVSLQSACGAGSEGDCAKRTKEELRPGLQVEVADADLKVGSKQTHDVANFNPSRNFIRDVVVRD